MKHKRRYRISKRWNAVCIYKGNENLNRSQVHISFPGTICTNDISIFLTIIMMNNQYDWQNMHGGVLFPLACVMHLQSQNTSKGKAYNRVRDTYSWIVLQKKQFLDNNFYSSVCCLRKVVLPFPHNTTLCFDVQHLRGSIKI